MAAQARMTEASVDHIDGDATNKTDKNSSDWCGIRLKTGKTWEVQIIKWRPLAFASTVRRSAIAQIRSITRRSTNLWHFFEYHERMTARRYAD